MGDVFDRKSLYARNKLNPDAIVCSDNTNGERLITREYFSSEAEFHFWKEWSDGDYHTQAKADNQEYKHTVSLHALAEGVGCVTSPEETAIRRFERSLRGNVSAKQIQLVQTIITEKQYRRLWLYGVEGMTQQEIGRRENVSQKRISKSIIAAKKKIKIFFQQVAKQGVKAALKR